MVHMVAAQTTFQQLAPIMLEMWHLGTSDESPGLRPRSHSFSLYASPPIVPDMCMSCTG